MSAYGLLRTVCGHDQAVYYPPMFRTARTLAAMILPPLLLYPLASFGLVTTKSPEGLLFAVLALLWAVGVSAVTTSGWRRPTVTTVGVGYSLAALAGLPLLALSASCAFGPCL